VEIHITAIVDKNAEIDVSCIIGPGVIIEKGVRIFPNVQIMANAYICEGTEIGENTVIHMGAIIGHQPQDHAYKGAKTFTKIGKNNIIREYVTIHRGTAEGSSTVVGDNNFLMGQVHLGHNCIESTEKYLRLTEESYKSIIDAVESLYIDVFPEVTHHE